MVARHNMKLSSVRIRC